MRDLPTDAEIQAALTAPGAAFEMTEVEVQGVRLRVWKNGPDTLRAVLERSRTFGDAPYLVQGARRISHAAHYAAVARFARLLIDRDGLRKGERVAIAMENRPDWSVAFFAAAAVGAVVTPLNTWWTGPELAYALRDSGAALLIADGRMAERIAPHLPETSVRTAIAVGGEAPPPFEQMEDLCEGTVGAVTLPAVDIAPDDPATIFYTSGTTGPPKGALGTHRNICTVPISRAYGQARALLRAGQSLPAPGEPQNQRASLLAVPLFNATGCHSVLITCACFGIKLVMMDGWDPDDALALIERERITHFGGVPTVLWQVMEAPSFGTRDLSSVEGVAYGGSPAPPELLARIRDKLPAAIPGNGYGLTETSSVTTLNMAGDYDRKPDSVGQPVAVCDLKVVDEAGQTVAAGETGEIWIRGPNVVGGYWNNSPATEEAFTDGWHRTGDLGRVDDEGFVYLLGRIKDIVIRGGQNVQCMEVEAALHSHAAVMDAAVVGLPHRVLGEEVAAVVQALPGAAVDEAALVAHAAAKLAPYKVPVRIEVRTVPLPRNANGKVLKPRLVAELTG